MKLNSASSADRFESFAQRLQIAADGDPVADLVEAVNMIHESYARILQLPGDALDDIGGVATEAAEPLRVDSNTANNRYNAWSSRLADPLIVGRGPLSGQRLVVKDCIGVRGLPLTLGGNLLEGYVPNATADVVSRALHAGAALAGSATCEDMCWSGSSFTSATGEVPNPYDPARSAGGSSSGCAVLIALGEADIGLGTDVGGSVRNPAAWCGICGLKPTFGLVPYTGALPAEPSMDHIGLLGRTPLEIASLLDAVAGFSEGDPRQVTGLRRVTSYTADLDGRIDGIRIGVLREGFVSADQIDPRVAAVVRQAGQDLQSLGATVTEVSVPLHPHAPEIHAPLVCASTVAMLIDEENLLQAYGGLEDDHRLASELRLAVRRHPQRLPLNGKISLVARQVLQTQDERAVLQQAQKLRGILRRQNDSALETCDVLLLPTTPMAPHPLPTTPLAAAEHFRLSFEMHANNCAQNLTGHPAITIPCGMIDDVPVGMLLVGRHLKEDLLLRIAHSYHENMYRCPSPSLSSDESAASLAS